MFIPSISGPGSVTTNEVASGSFFGRDYLFNAGLVMPDIDPILTYLQPHFLSLTQLIDMIGASEPTNDSVFSWALQGRTRKAATVSSVTIPVPASPTIAGVVYNVIEQDPDGSDYFLVGDVIRTENGTMARVTAVNDSNNQITLVKINGTNWVAGDIANTESIGHVSTSFPFGSDGPGYRASLPQSDYNFTQIFRRAVRFSRDMMDTISWIHGPNGQKFYYYNHEVQQMFEFKRDQEAALLLGIRGTVDGTRHTEGVWTKVVSTGGGQLQQYSGSVSETDIQDLFTKLSRENLTNEYVLLCGSEFVRDFMVALRDYSLGGAVNYGSFGQTLAGLNFQGFRFGDKTLYLKHYHMFDDSSILPYTAAASTSTKINFRKAALLIPIGSTTSGEPFMKLRYKMGEYGDSKMIYKEIPGMVAPGPIGSNSFDGTQKQLLAECGIQVKQVNAFGAFVPVA